jgi:hypothetical protein
MPFNLYCGRMISGSKSAPKGHVCVFNANLCTKSKGKFWFGDLDLSEPRDQEQLKLVAHEKGEDVYVLREMDARFRNEEKPLFENAVARITPTGQIHMAERVA